MRKLLLSIAVLVFVVPASLSSENKSFNRERTYDVLHYIMRLDFDRPAKIVKGDSTVELTPLESAISTVDLDARDLNFEFVGLEGSNDELPYKVIQPKTLRITLPREYKPGEKIAFRIRYTAKPKKGIYFVDELRDGNRRIHSSQVWTQGESEETHHWLPSFDFPDDKATTEQFLTAEPGETAIGNGEFLGKKELENGRAVFHYKMNVPHSLYLTSFVIGEYNKVEDKYKDIPLGYYVYPGQEKIVEPAYGKTKDMFALFEDLTKVDYPYNKYDQTMVADFAFGGMENITATTMADSQIMLARLEFGRPLVEDLVAHELAHSWFGNLVTCRNWAELWLNEGFATFLEAVFREKAYGRANYDGKIRDEAAAYMGYAVGQGNIDHALFNTLADASDDDSMFTTVTYQKGGSVIHMLREELGDEAFWKGVNIYLKKHEFQTVETPDLIEAMEEASGRDLKWFFDQWVYKRGFPRLKVAHGWDSRTGKARLRIEQTQASTSANKVPSAFRLPFDVKFETSNGAVTRTVLVEKRSQEFILDVPGQPSKVEIDPANKIPIKHVSYSAITIR
ncbi:MAG: M1 family peptidase [Acidobacteria bacterium]|nr:MAG: M1 family peptidase [Acidobacteriota bacterium]REK01357.1 MAG: M1 family peptidase [Acidobacteriota bacterium]REK14313.1 MAG: M1 family peptidase [Acidobacteriota bacterium]REK45028.1 MAG: M1 family peptidase [Acidobacteriota bacterium]